MKNSRMLLPGLIVSAVALAGCETPETTTSEAAPTPTKTSEPSPTETVSNETAISDTPTPVPTQHWLAPPPAPANAATDPEAWADYKYTEWLHGMNTTYRTMCGELTDLSVYRDCVPDDPHAYITDFSATELGELVITIGDGPWEDGPYDTEAIPAAHFVAGNASFDIAKFGTDFDSITAVTPDGSSYTEPYDPNLEAYFDHVALEDLAAG